MLKVAMAGAQDTGKTTVSRMLAGKLSAKGILTHYVTEYARDYLPKAGMITSLAEELFMVKEQLKRERDTPERMQVMVTDSPLFLGYVYTTLMTNGLRTMDKKAVMMMGVIFDKILDQGGYDLVFLLPALWEPVDDGVRPAELRQQNDDIAKRIDAFVTLHGVDVVRMNAHSIQDRTSVLNYYADMTCDTVLKALGKTS